MLHAPSFIYPSTAKEQHPIRSWKRGTGGNVGKISLRLGHNYHSYWNGNVGYEVDEPYRGNHYAVIALKLVLPIAKAHGMDQLIISCDEDNAASYRTIERCGGSLLEISHPPKDWIYYRPGLALKRIYRIKLWFSCQNACHWQTKTNSPEAIEGVFIFEPERFKTGEGSLP